MISLRLLLTGLALPLLIACTEQSPDQGTVRTTDSAQKASSHGLRVSESFEVGSNVIVRALAEDTKRGQMWVGTSVGALQIDLKSGAMIATHTRQTGLANEYVFAAMVDGSGETWLGTNGGGVSWRQGDQWKTFFPMHGLADYWVYSFTEQPNGDVWIGTWAGLNRYSRADARMDTYLKELVNEWVYGLDVDSSGKVWIGTEGGVNMFDGTSWHVWTHEQGLGAANKQGLPFSANTGLGTRTRHDLSVLTEGNETYNPNYVFSIKVDRQDRVWAGTWGGGVSMYKEGVWRSFTEEDGLAGNIVYALAEDSEGRMWFGTDKGVGVFDGQMWSSLGPSDGLFDQHVYAVLAASNGEVWAGTRHGVAKITFKQ